MTIYLDREPFLTIPDKLHPGQYKVIRNPDWHGELPEIVSFTDFLKWNYTLEYGRHIRELHYYRQLPLPWGVPRDADIETVIIEEGRYDRIDHDSFDMYVICNVVFDMNGCRQCQKYIVHGYYCSNGVSDFLCDAELYNGQFIRLNNPLDEFLVPILSKKDFESIAQKIFEGFYPYKSNYPGCINTFVIARFMGLDIKYARLSKNGKVKSKLILDKRDTTVYDKDGKTIKMKITGPTILVYESLEEEEAQNAIIHECVHAYLHNLFYELQSYYRKMVGRKMPEFNDYFYSKTQRSCLKWMETQANAIPRFIQMPEEQASEVILNFFEKLPGEPDWDDYRELIDLVKWKFGVSRNAAKKCIIELGWPEVRGVYVYNTTGYVEDYDVELRFPDDYNYTLSFSHISDVFASCETFAELVRSKKFIYLDGHVVINCDRYIRKEHGIAMGLTEYTAEESDMTAPYEADTNTAVFKQPGLIPISELAEILPTLNRISSWIEAVFAFVSSEAINHGVPIPGYKVVEGRSKRVFTDTKAVVDTAVQNGYTDLYKQTLITLTEFEKMMGKKKFNELLGEYVAKPPGKLALVPESDPREPVDLTSAPDQEFSVLPDEE